MMGEEMTGRKRTALLATVVSLLGTAVAVPMIVSGTASAQSGSRLCGKFFATKDRSERVTLLYEVPKDTPGGFPSVPCTAAKDSNLGPFDSPFNPENKTPTPDPENPTFNIKLKVADTKVWEHVNDVESWECESYSTLIREGHSNILKTIGDNFPLTTADQNDLCNNMNRSDTLATMQRYWLYNDEYLIRD